jgi:hypothetical protein
MASSSLDVARDDPERSRRVVVRGLRHGQTHRSRVFRVSGDCPADGAGLRVRPRAGDAQLSASTGRDAAHGAPVRACPAARRWRSAFADGCRARRSGGAGRPAGSGIGRTRSSRHHRDRIWGPPDLVVEIVSPHTERRDRTTKVGWYRNYGVRECWLITATHHWVEVIELQSTSPARLFWGPQRLRSTVLPDWDVPVQQIFV